MGLIQCSTLTVPPTRSIYGGILDLGLVVVVVLCAWCSGGVVMVLVVVLLLLSYEW